MFVGYVRGKKKLFPQIEDFPYAKTLSPEAYNELKRSLDEKIEKYFKQKKFIAMLMAQKNKAESAA